uniref:Uncharacterized protein n=1 Tax=Bartonella schoenbuchensis (strain DSM 13525 / NCTC 13165 / R1) TaxID=687861 RepID=E6Z029_BARSR|nr:hypothetical protein B11C_40322 [Bartonella schoenbuchensis R1]
MKLTAQITLHNVETKIAKLICQHYSIPDALKLSYKIQRG